jgi:dihydrofolate synthase / folylpolyglutamate synthase
LSGSSLQGWLERLERRAPESRVELGLDRVREVFGRLNIDLSDHPVITVAGTNGKGSVVAFLEQTCRHAGYRVFAYSSPHLVDFRERMRIDGQLAPASAIAAALDRVEAARDDVFLTYFEHITLAALVLARESDVDVVILEVGLGGRLDAVNVIDADVAVISSIGLDHTAWLGRTRLQVAREKAGIARSGRPLVVGERRLPPGWLADLESSGAELMLAGRDFRWRKTMTGFSLRTRSGQRQLPEPAMAGAWQRANAACAIVALEALGDRLAINDQAVIDGLVSARVPGRFQCLGECPQIVVDVAHNPAAARALADELGPADGHSVAVFSALADKDLEGLMRPLIACFDHWILAPLSTDRACPVERLQATLQQVAVTASLETVESVPEAFRCALERAGTSGRVVVFGSIRTVAEVWPELESLR